MNWYLPYIALFGSLISNENSFDYLPVGAADIYVTRYSQFSLSYNNDHKQANWVAYELTSEELTKDITRKDYFSEDKKAGTKWAKLKDYKYSGYDRGHLCRAEYCKSNKDAYKESFLLSNMSPQIGAGFNRTGGSWCNLEELEMKLARQYGKLYAVSGPVFRDNLGTIGENKITIPGYFYKAFLLPDYQAAIGFILRHEVTGNHPLSFAVTIDSLEIFTNVDFYPSLPDSVENAIEASLSLKYWNINFSADGKAETSVPVRSAKEFVQCNGLARPSGGRCARRTKNGNGYCWQHME